MTYLIINSKHWQVLAVILFPHLINQLVDGFMSVVCSILGLFFYLFWLLIITTAIKDRQGINSSFFIINVFYVFSYYSIMNILFEPNSGFALSGLPAIGGIYFILAFLYIIAYTAKTIIGAETRNSNPQLTSAIYECILIILYPIGVWLIQPRINRLYDYITESDPI